MSRIPKPARIYQPKAASLSGVTLRRGNKTNKAKTEVAFKAQRPIHSIKRRGLSRSKPSTAPGRAVKVFLPPKESLPVLGANLTPELIPDQSVPRQHQYAPNWQLINQIGAQIACMMLVLAAVWAMVNWLKVKEVSCELDQQSCPLEIYQVLQQFNGQPLFFNDFTQKTLALPTLQLQLATVGVTKRLSGQLHLKLTSAQILYQLMLDDQLLMMNANQQLQQFVLSSPTDQRQIIRIEFEPLKQQIFQTKQVPAFYHQVWLDVLTGFASYPIAEHVTAIRLADDEKLRLSTDWGIDFVFDQTEIGQSWQKFDYIGRNVAAEKLRLYREVDLRFKSPVAMPREDIQD